MAEFSPEPATNHLGDIGQIARAIAAELHNQPTRQVLTGDEAVVYCKLASYRAFTSWRRRFHVPACGHKRFALVKLDMGLDRESRQIRARF